MKREVTTSENSRVRTSENPLLRKRNKTLSKNINFFKTTKIDQGLQQSERVYSRKNAELVQFNNCELCGTLKCLHSRLFPRPPHTHTPSFRAPSEFPENCHESTC